MNRRKPKMKTNIVNPSANKIEDKGEKEELSQSSVPQTVNIHDLSGADPCVPLIIDDLPKADPIVSPEIETNSEFVKKIKELMNDRDEWKAQYIRLKADFENYRKREDDRQARAKSVGREILVEALLPVFESLNKAIDLCKPETSLDGLKGGLDIAFKLFNQVLKENGVDIIGELNDPFDPLLHQAIAKDEADQIEDCIEVISQVYQSGIVVNGRVFKPAMVKVGYKPKDNNLSNAKSANDTVNNADSDLTS